MPKQSSNANRKRTYRNHGDVLFFAAMRLLLPSTLPKTPPKISIRRKPGGRIAIDGHGNPEPAVDTHVQSFLSVQALCSIL